MKETCQNMQREENISVAKILNNTRINLFAVFIFRKFYVLFHGRVDYILKVYILFPEFSYSKVVNVQKKDITCFVVLPTCINTHVFLYNGIYIYVYLNSISTTIWYSKYN